MKKAERAMAKRRIPGERASDGLSIRHIWKRNLPHILIALLAWAISQLFYLVCRRIPWVRRWVI